MEARTDWPDWLADQLLIIEAAVTGRKPAVSNKKLRFPKKKLCFQSSGERFWSSDA
jgi:hypothetical protein